MHAKLIHGGTGGFCLLGIRDEISNNLGALTDTMTKNRGTGKRAYTKNPYYNV